VVGATDPHGRILDFLDRSRYYVASIYRVKEWDK
jgi:hypothetical protein